MSHPTVFVSKRLRSWCHLFLLGSAMAVGITSAPAAETSPPTITTQPGVSDVVAGTDATLTVVATGTGTLGYQWRHAGVLIAGATGPTLTVRDVAMADAGLYDVVVSDGSSTTTSNLGRVVVRPFAYPNAVAPVKSFAPRFETLSRAITTVVAAPDGSTFVGGSFTSLNEVERKSLARLRADGSVDLAFVPARIRGSVSAIALQPDGKCVLGGTFTKVGASARFGIARLNVDGALDETFDPGAGFTSTSANGSPRVYVLAIQPNGKIVVGGLFDSFNGTERRNLVRLNSNGSLDATFVTGAGPDGEVNAAVVQANGRVIVGGAFSTYNGAAALGIAGLTATGSLDSTFTADVGWREVNALVLQPDDKILVGGSRMGGPNGLARLNADGTSDETFITDPSTPWPVLAIGLLPNGRIVVGSFQNSYRSPRPLTVWSTSGAGVASPDAPHVGLTNYGMAAVLSIATLPDGRIIAAGNFGFGSYGGQSQNGTWGVAGFGSDYVWDPRFELRPGSPASVQSIAPVPGGKWLVRGDFTVVNGVPRAGLARIEANGDLDATFNLPSAIVLPESAVVQGDGRVVLSYHTTTPANRDVVTRVQPDGAIDPSFVAPAFFSTRSALVMPDGRLLVGGPFSIEEFHRFARLQADGSLDHSLHPGSGPNGPILAMHLLPDRRILLAGDFTQYDGADRGSIARLGAEGALDLSFAAGAGFNNAAAPNVVPRVLVCDLLPDGRIMAAGEFTHFGSSPRNGIARLHEDGSLDLSFTPDLSAGAHIYAVVPQADGRVLVGGNLDQPVVRLNADGSRDPTFAIGDHLPASYPPITRAIAVTAEGRLLVAGQWTEFSDFTGRGLVLLESTTPFPPVINSAPQPQATTAGGATTLSVDASGIGEVGYQWQHLLPGNGPFGATPTADTWVDIPGAAGANYTIPSAQQFHRGSYRVVVTANGVAVISDPVTLSVTAPPPNSARLLNLSARAQALTGDDVLIPGFVIAGTGNKRLLIRAVGPTLGKPPFNLGGVLPDPRLRLLKRNPTTQAFEEIAANDNWGTNPNAAAVTQTAADVFAFAFNDDREAALLLDLAPGEYTAIASGTNNVTGIAIVELYDADASGTGPRLINISNRGFAGVGDQVMIPGFVVSSEGPKTLLVRVVGPTLSGFGVPGTMANPRLTVYSGQTAILENDNWGDNPEAAYTAQIASQVSAFPLTAGSKDAAFVITLPPGSYTVVGSSAVAGGTGIVLVEVYVAP